MKKIVLFIALLFSVGFAYSQVDENLSPEEKARRQRNIDMGNPFARFGYKPKIATLSKGKYLEFHDRDTIVKIGSFSYHTRNKTVTGYYSLDSLRSEATLHPTLISRWFSPDPLSDEFPSWSPYNFVFNNPIRFVDPDGRAPDDIIFLNNKDEEIARIVTGPADFYVNVDTDLSLPEPIIIDPFTANEGGGTPDAVNISFEYSGVMGGGIVGGESFVFFLEGNDEGNLYSFSKIGGGVGLDAEIGVQGGFSIFNGDEADSNLLNAKGMAGKYSGYSAGAGVSGSYEWSNEDNVSELWPGMKSTTTWESYSIGGGIGGEAGAKAYWGKLKLNSEKPILSTK